MREFAQKHLDTIATTLAIEYGEDFKSDLKNFAKYWRGPLFDKIYLVGDFAVKHCVTRKGVAKILSSINVDVHPIYNRDFFQGIIDAGCICLPRVTFPAIEVTGNSRLRSFLKSEECGLNIKFYGGRGKNISHDVPYFLTKCKGDLESYLSGVLTASTPVMKDGQLLFKVNKKCKDNFRRLNLIFLEDEESLYLSPFYVMIFSGEIPFNIYSYFLCHIVDLKYFELKQARLDALFHWRYINGLKRYKVGDFPFLEAPMTLHAMGITFKKFDIEMKEKRCDFVDERLAKRCKRWYVMHGMLKNPTKVFERKMEK